MSISMSRALAGAMLDDAPFRTLMDECFLKVYSGIVPSNADPALPAAEAALGAAVLLCLYSDDGGAGGLNWAAAAEDNIIQKESTQTWKGTAVADGVATFFRYVVAGDDGSASTTAHRVQGLCGTAFGDMLLASTTFAVGQEKVVPSAFFGLGGCS